MRTRMRICPINSHDRSIVVGASINKIPAVRQRGIRGQHGLRDGWRDGHAWISRIQDARCRYSEFGLCFITYQTWCGSQCKNVTKHTKIRTMDNREVPVLILVLLGERRTKENTPLEPQA